MFNLGSIAAIAAYFGVGNTPETKNKTSLKSKAESPDIQTWFNSDAGKEFLLNKETTSPLAKKTWIELSLAEKQLVSNEYRETQRNQLTRFTKKADLIPTGT